VGARISKFADDTKIARVVNSEVDCLGLEEDIDKMIKWADRLQMEFNPEKCEVIHFGRSKLTRKYTTKDLTLGTSKEQRDPGVFVYRSPKAETQVNTVV